MVNSLNLRQALESGAGILRNAGIETPVVDAGVLLCSAAGFDRAFLYAHGKKELDDESLSRYMEYLRQRAEGKPVQYITGICGFMSLDFIVGPGVLIPRPETETLVEKAVEMLQCIGIHGDGSCVYIPEILDIGTGSGCIAVSLAQMLKSSRVTAVDVSAQALRIARLNAQRTGVEGRLEFIESDLFGSLTGRKFDAIVSNPPYIRRDDIEGLQREIRDFEPHTALDGGPDGLDFYRRIAGPAPLYLKKGGFLLLEVGMGQASEVAGLMEGSFADIGIIKDLSGIDRVVVGCLK